MCDGEYWCQPDWICNQLKASHTGHACGNFLDQINGAAALALEEGSFALCYLPSVLTASSSVLVLHFFIDIGMSFFGFQYKMKISSSTGMFQAFSARLRLSAQTSGLVG